MEERQEDLGPRTRDLLDHSMNTWRPGSKFFLTPFPLPVWPFHTVCAHRLPASRVVTHHTPHHTCWTLRHHSQDRDWRLFTWVPLEPREITAWGSLWPRLPTGPPNLAIRSAIRQKMEPRGCQLTGTVLENQTLRSLAGWEKIFQGTAKLSIPKFWPL